MSRRGRGPLVDSGPPGLLEHERQALEFLSLGPDQIGLVDSDDKFAAAIVFLDLTKRGFATYDEDPDGPIFSITPAGKAALRTFHRNLS
jgi:hypothetical protein